MEAGLDDNSSRDSSMHSGSFGDMSAGSGKSDARSQPAKVEECEKHGREKQECAEAGIDFRAGHKAGGPLADLRSRRGPDSSCSSTNEKTARRTKTKRSRRVQVSVKDDAQRAVRHWSTSPSTDSMALYRWSLSASSYTLEQQDLHDKKSETVRIVAAVLAFQRWRQYHLKKLFHHQLSKMTQEVKHDDECLANLEKEIANKDLHLARALSDMAQMRAQLSHSNRARRTNVDDLHKRLAKAQQRASDAEQQLRKQDGEVKRLTQSLSMVEEETRRVDSQLHADMATLQSEKDGALGEVRVLLDQLARRDEELASQSKENDKLRAALVRLAERQASQEKQMESLRLEHQEQLVEANAAKLAAQMELASCTERCKGLLQDKENLALELQRAAEQADHSSKHAEELNMASQVRSKATEGIAAEMIEHLKLLTRHMRQLESTVEKSSPLPGSWVRKSTEGGLHVAGTKAGRFLSKSDQHPFMRGNPDESHQGRGPQGKVDDSVGKQQGAGDRRSSPSKVETGEHACPISAANTQFLSSSRLENVGRCSHSTTKDLGTQQTDTYPPTDTLTGSGKRVVAFSDKHVLPSQEEDDGGGLKREKWVTWRWKWVVAAAKIDRLLKEVRNLELLNQQHSTQEKEKLGSEKKLDDDGLFMARHRLVPLILAAWRSYTKVKKLERRAIKCQQSLDGQMAALPWWIRRVGDWRCLERSFSRWQRFALKSGKMRLCQEKPPGYPPPSWHCHASRTDRHIPVGRKVHMILPQGSGGRSSQQSINKAAQIRAGGDRTPGAVHRYNNVISDAAFHGSPARSARCGDDLGQPTHTAAAAHLRHQGTEDPAASTIITARALKCLQQDFQDLKRLLANEVAILRNQTQAQEAWTSSRGKYVQSSKKSQDAIWEVCNALASALNEAGRRLLGPEIERGATAAMKRSRSPVAVRKTVMREPSKSTVTSRHTNAGVGAADEERQVSRAVGCVVQISKDCNVKVEPLQPSSRQQSPRAATRQPGHHHRHALRASEAQECGAEDHCLGSQYANLLKSEVLRLQDGFEGEGCFPAPNPQPICPAAATKRLPWRKYYRYGSC